jgi:ABC-2 type transport system permease protein
MGDILRAPIRTFAFIRKEIFEVLRQPRLILTLVLGPFLILLLVGIGFRNVARPFRTLFVVPQNDPLASQVEAHAKSLGEQLIFTGLTDDETHARERLRRGEVELVVIAPANAYETILSSNQAVFTVYHNEIDPIQASYVSFVGQIYVEEVNRRILRALTARGQGEASTIQDDLSAARASAAAVRESLQNGDAATAREHQRELDSRISGLELAVGATAGLLGSVGQTLGGGQDANNVNAALEGLKEVRQDTDSLNELPENQNDYTVEAETAARIEAGLATLETTLGDFQSISPVVIVSPFRSEAKSVAPIQLDATDFFAPAVLALLIQHLAVTFGALSIVRERQLGTVELFRVSPISPGEALVGKYLSYMLFTGMLAAILTGLLVFALQVPMLGDWRNYIFVLAALIFTSLGIGFVISLIAQTDSQAVQYAMLALLASVFFSGFLINLYVLWEPVRAIAWSLPVTYGMQMLQNIMLRGLTPSPFLLTLLATIGLVLFLIAWLLMSRLMARR